MTEIDAFSTFVARALTPSRAKRFSELAASEKGRRKILNALCHEFERAIASSVRRVSNLAKARHGPCFAYHTSCGFGASFPTIAAARDALSLDDGWLIVSDDGDFGIYRPEAPRWDAEVGLVV